MQLPNALEPRPRRMRGAGHGASTALVPAVILALTILALLLTGQPVSAQTPSNDATLSALTVDGTSVAGFAADRDSYEFGVVHTTTQVTVLATPNDSGAMVGYAPADADTTADGHQVDLTAGQNAVTIAVAAADGVTSATYTLNVNRGTDADYGWKAVDDVDGLAAADNTAPAGIWSNGTTMWVMDSSDKKIYAYTLATNARNTAQDFDTLDAAGNDSPTGIWSDGTTMWVMDSSDEKIYAYNLATKARDASKDLDAHDDAGTDIFSDGTTMWVSNDTNDRIYAYTIATDTRDTSKEFDSATLRGADNRNVRGIWSDGVTMWVADSGDNQLFAYDLDTKARVSGKDFNTLSGAGQTSPAGPLVRRRDHVGRRQRRRQRSTHTTCPRATWPP